MNQLSMPSPLVHGKLFSNTLNFFYITECGLQFYGLGILNYFQEKNCSVISLLNIVCQNCGSSLCAVEFINKKKSCTFWILSAYPSGLRLPRKAFTNRFHSLNICNYVNKSLVITFMLKVASIY